MYVGFSSSKYLFYKGCGSLENIHLNEDGNPVCIMHQDTFTVDAVLKNEIESFDKRNYWLAPNGAPWSFVFGYQTAFEVKCLR